MGGNTEQPTQTTQAVLSPEQQELMGLAMPGLRKFAASVPKRYKGETVAGFDPAQTQGQNMVLGATGSQQQIADTAADNNNFLMGDIWNPASNPNLQGAIDAAVRPVTQRYQEVVRPALRDEFAGAGQQFGGSRRNIAEGGAARDYMSTVGDTASKLVQDQYATNLGANLKALALAPQTQGAQAVPGLTTSGVGDVRQSMAQELLNSKIGAYNYDQMAPFLQSKELMSLLTGMPGGSTVSTGNTPQGNPITGALGGAASGASLGSIFGPMGSVGGAGIGALLSFL